MAHHAYKFRYIKMIQHGFTDPFMSNKETPTIQVLERAFMLLDALSKHPEPVVLKKISELTGLHNSTAHRILNDLVIGGYVDRPQAGQYRLGMRLLEMCNCVKARLDVREVAVVPMRELYKIIHQPVNLSMRQDDEIIYIERAYSERSGMQVVRTVGGRAPLHLTSVGKLFLAQEDEAGLKAYVERTAASVLDDQGQLVAGLSISSPADRMEEPWLEQLKETAARISAALGYRTPV
jgi:DNA-binding IclR family transcriptional regulator